MRDAPSLDAFTRVQSTFCAFQPPAGGTPLLWGGLSLLAQVCAQCLIAALAMRGAVRVASDQSLVASLREACRTVASRATALLLGWLPYVLLVSVAAAGLSAPLLVLHPGATRPLAIDDLTDALARPVDLVTGLLGGEVVQRVVTSLLPHPGSLLCGVVGSAQAAAFKPTADPAGPVWQPASTYQPPVYPADAAGVWPAALGGLALLLVFGTLLRFRSAAALAGVPSQARSGLRVGWAGAIVAGRHFGTVALHGGLLRSATTGAQILFVAAPTLLAERLAIPWVGRLAWSPWAIPACVLVVAAGVALVDGMLCAFAAVYDARLYAALTFPGAAPPRRHAWWEDWALLSVPFTPPPKPARRPQAVPEPAPPEVDWLQRPSAVGTPGG